jgi:hypothetical protein
MTIGKELIEEIKRKHEAKKKAAREREIIKKDEIQDEKGVI